MCAVPQEREMGEKVGEGEKKERDPHRATEGGVALPPPRRESRRSVRLLWGGAVGAKAAEAVAGVSCWWVRAVAGEAKARQLGVVRLAKESAVMD